MLEQIRQRLHDYRLTRAAAKVVTQGDGYAARTWALPATASEWPEVRTTITDWLALQLTGTATPYGFSHYNVGFALVRLGDGKRTALWHELLPGFERTATMSGLDAAQERLQTLPVADHPSVTHVEVYLMSLGDILKQGYERLGYE